MNKIILLIAIAFLLTGCGKSSDERQVIQQEAYYCINKNIHLSRWSSIVRRCNISTTLADLWANPDKADNRNYVLGNYYEYKRDMYLTEK